MRTVLCSCLILLLLNALRAQATDGQSSAGQSSAGQSSAGQSDWLDFDRQVTHGYVHNGDVKLHYASVGRRGPLVVMLHGFPARASLVDQQCQFSGKAVRVDCLTLYEGRVVGFCNPKCRDKFAHDPERYASAKK